MKNGHARACLAKPLIAAALAAAIAGFALSAAPAFCETATVYGTTAGIFSGTPGAFRPANTGLSCFSLDKGKCWDGRKWHRLYPAGPRHYAVATTERVACSVIVAPGNDCWTGSVWYRLPHGQIFGAVAGIFSRTPGAFVTAPLR
jgi:hypothetical protein